MMKDMLLKEIRFLSLFICVIMFNSCESEDFPFKSIEKYKDVNFQEIEDAQCALQIFMESLIEERNEFSLSYLSPSSWAVDDVIYFSNDKRRLYVNILRRKTQWKNAKTDIAKSVIGAYIDGSWCFLFGDVTIISRKSYKYDYTTPFTFEELSYFVNRSFFPRNVTYENGEYKVSEKFFSNYLKELDSSNPDGDSLFRARVNNYTTDTIPQEKIDRIRQEQKESVPLKLEPQSLFQKWFGKKKLFDSKEWKNRRMKAK
jgi:hypothetical protein